MTRILDVYFHEILAGKLTQDDSGTLSFHYSETYISNPNALQSVRHKPIPISISMPLRDEPYTGVAPKAFFSGLLPDDIVRHKLAHYLGLSEKNPFSLLEAIGGECAGALALFREGEKPPQSNISDVEILDEQKLSEILELLKRRPLMAGGDNIRLSLAGAQDKIAVGLVNNKIALVRGSTPTTHILKPLIEGIADSVHNEVFCMNLAKRLKIDVPDTEIRWLGSTPYFLIERYDRIRDETGHVTRLHQEDFCQALSIMPELKYEREGGPNIQQCLTLLQNHALQPAIGRSAFMRRLIFNYLIGNSDAHGKNYSFLYNDVSPSLSPAYDLLSTAVYSELSSKMAMKIGKEYDPEKIFLRHWKSIVPNTTAAQKTIEKELINISKDCLEEAHILKDSFVSRGISSPIIDKICSVIQKRTDQILAF